MAIDTLKWNGSAWVTAPVKRWNGSAWVDAYTRRWNGSSWVQMYPESLINATQYINSSGTNNFRSGKWEGGVAKQGNWGYGDSTGFLGLNAWAFTGAGNITNVSGAAFRGSRDGSGYYNNDQNIWFYRSEVAPNGNPGGTITGQFNATTGAPGSGGWMTDRWIAGHTLGAFKDWVNVVNGKNQLYIYSTSKSDYMGIGSPQIGMDYTYMARLISFESPYMMLQMTPDMYMDIKGKRPYHSMIIYDDEVNLTLEEIMKRREDGIVEPINIQSRMVAPEIAPWTRDYEVIPKIELLNGSVIPPKFKIEVLNQYYESVPEMSVDGIFWTKMSGIPENHDDSMYGNLPEDFNKNTNKIWFRLRNSKTDSIDIEKVIEPEINIIL